MVIFKTSLGSITVTLNEKKAPITVKNFLNYVKSGHYEQTIFHRVIKGFMIQVGGFDTNFKEKKSKDGIRNEANNGLKNTRGALAMARTSDPHSASGQFFINTVDNSFLDFTAENSSGWGYAVFGQVTDGMNVVDKIEAVKTASKNGHENVPIENIVLQEVVIT